MISALTVRGMADGEEQPVVALWVPAGVARTTCFPERVNDFETPAGSSLSSSVFMRHSSFLAD
jgi:hypothetical protein